MTDLYRRRGHYEAMRIVDLAEAGVIVEVNGEREHIAMRKEKLHRAKVGDYLMTEPRTGVRWVLSEAALVREYERV